MVTSTSAESIQPRQVDAWVTAVGVPEPVVRSVVRSVARAGVRLSEPPGESDEPRHSVIAFAVMTKEVVEHVRTAARDGSRRVLALSTAAHPPADDSWRLLRAGASDVLTWCENHDVVGHIAERLRRWSAIDELLACQHVREFLVGGSPVWLATLRNAVELARFTPAAVLVTGESGTGKERVAQLIHELDPRPRKKKLVVLDCSTVVASLSGSEFFGHEKGAFTGAASARAGAFELADGGTLFLDEVGELPVTLQAELLRVIQEGTFKRVGSNIWHKSTFRLVCATNRDLTESRAEGTFREDFYHRIAGSTLHLPSLRERTDDIIPLFRHFFHELHPDRDPPELEDPVRDLLVHRTYPGNVRDLRSLALRISHRHVGDGVITVGDVPDHERPRAEPCSGRPDPAFERSIRMALAQGATPDDITRTAARVAREWCAGNGSAPAR